MKGRGWPPTRVWATIAVLLILWKEGQMDPPTPHTVLPRDVGLRSTGGRCTGSAAGVGCDPSRDADFSPFDFARPSLSASRGTWVHFAMSKS